MLFSLVNEHSGLALTLGQPTLQQPFRNQDNQRFDLRASKIDDASHHLDAVEFVADAQCAGDEMILRVCGCSIWILETVAPGFIILKSIQNSGMVLGVVDSSMRTNAGVELQARIDRAPLSPHVQAQTWRLTPTNRVLFPMFTSAEMKSYSCDFQEIKTELPRIIEEHGFCVIENVLTPSEIKLSLAAWGRDLLGTLDTEKLLSELSCMDEGEKKTKLQQIITDLQGKDHDVIPSIYPGVGQTKMDFSRHSNAHGEFAWGVRSNMKVREIFKTMYHLKENETDLVVGMDAVFFNPQGAPGAQSDKIWGHADQNTHEPVVADWSVYQGVVAVWDLDAPTCSTTVVWPGSHKHAFDKLMESPRCADLCPHPGAATPRVRQFVELKTLLEPHLENTRDAAWLNERYVRESRRVPMKAGSVILWNSRTMHQGWNQGPRLAVPICWEPRKRRSEQAYHRKLRLCASGLPTTHWASLGVQHNMDLTEAHAPTPLEFDFFTAQSKNYEGDDIILQSSVLNNDQGKGIDLRLPRRTRLPMSLQQDMGLDFEKDVKPLCKALEDSSDDNADFARSLEVMIKPEVRAMI